MRKLLVITLVFAFLCSPVLVNSVRAEKNASAAILSLVMPGAGEWYNNGWQGSFPWGECVVGHICFCFQFSSALDAANGNTDTNMRFDFWTAPVK
jgi:hypothetical protein